MSHLISKRKETMRSYIHENMKNPHVEYTHDPSSNMRPSNFFRKCGLGIPILRDLSRGQLLDLHILISSNCIMPTAQVRTSLGRPRKPVEDAKSVRHLSASKNNSSLTATDTTRPGPRSATGIPISPAVTTLFTESSRGATGRCTWSAEPDYARIRQSSDQGWLAVVPASTFPDSTVAPG